MAHAGLESAAANRPTDLTLLVERAEYLATRAAKLDRIADDLLLLAPATAKPSSGPRAATPVELMDSSWEAAGIPALTIGIRELAIFSILLALGVGAAFFVGYIASRQVPGVFD